VPEPRPAGRSFVRWHILALLVAASFIAYVLRSNMSVAGERMMSELGLSQVQLGVILAAFAWGYAICQLPGGILGDRLGGRKALALIMVAWGVINMLTGLVPRGASPIIIMSSLAAMRFLMGVAQAPVYPVMGGQSIARWFPPAGWAVPNALTNVGLTFGSAATGPLIAWLVERLGWRLSFIVTGPIAFVMAAAWWWYARDRPEEHSAVRTGELAIINVGRSPRTEAPEPAGAWRRVLRDRNVLLITGSYFLDNYVFYFFFNWLYVYLVDVRKFTVLQGGAMAAAPWIVGAFGAAIGGYACDAITRRRGIRIGTRLVGMVGLLLASGFIVLAAMAGNPYVAVIWLSLCLAAQQATDSAYWAACTAVGGRHASAACGVMNTGGNAVGGVGALLVPYMAQAAGWPVALAMVSAFGVLGAILWLWINAEHRVEAA
jgi:ACS family glucarate transporter-like MFS transporter